MATKTTATKTTATKTTATKEVKAVAPKAVAPKAAAPKAVAPKAVAPKAAAPKAAAPKAAAPKAAAPKAAAPKAVAPKAVAPKAAAPKAVAPKAVAPKAAAPVLASNDEKAINKLSRKIGEVLLPNKNTKADNLAKARAARGTRNSRWESLSGKVVSLLSTESKSLVGKFIISFLSNPEEKDMVFTCAELAKGFVDCFTTKTGIKPDDAWAKRNVELFIAKGLIKAE